jgi:type IV pilus assembly protein PilB
VARARAHGLSPFNVQRYQISSATFERIPQDFCQQNLVLPVGEVGNYLLVALANPFEVAISTKIQEMTGKKVVRLLGRERDIRDKFSKTQQVEVQFTDVVEKIGIEFGAAEEIKEEDLANEESGPIIDLANRIIEDAYFAGTSDIHIEPWEKELVVRYRIDGVCQEKLRLPIKVAGALVARLKIMSNLDIAERRLPQDGRIVFKQFTRKSIDIDLRVSTSPLNHGEGIVLRILDKQKSTLPLQMLGFTEANLVIYRKVIRQPYGMVLHCGPTGSGKSMTLYSALNEISSSEVVIRTAEDPIEYTLAGINQMQMHRQIGLTFAAALRAFLRQDPDIILVGEIRDRETAEIAVEAALTGHLLLSTLHTNDAPTAVARLTDMGIERFMLSASLLCICAQRLMRRVCKNCKVPVAPEGREKELIERALGWSGPIFKHNPRGCPRCNHTGYKGRVGIHELMVVSEGLIDGINRGLETSELKKIAMRQGMKTLHQDSMIKVKEGVSTFEEALATVPPDL